MTRHRRRQIVELVERDGAAHVDTLAQQFGVSAVTIRNDLDELETAGELVRDRGGAISTPAPRRVSHLLGLQERAGLNLEAKQRIGRAAAQLVSAGDSIILDAGTTVVEMTPLLNGIAPLTIVTNALNVALAAAAGREVEVILLGGTLNRQASSTIGPLTEQTLASLRLNKVFLGTQALALSSGLTDTTFEIAQSKRAMIRSAREVILLADSSKWDHTGFIQVAPLEEIDILVTDENFPATARVAVERLGVKVVLA